MTCTRQLSTIRYNLTYDVVFKETFTNVLKGTAKILNIILNENIKEDEITVTSNELLGESVDVKNSLLDIRLNVLKRLDVNLEMQKDRNYNYSLIERMIIYNSRMISESMTPGNLYKGKKCISIVFINFPLEEYQECVNIVSHRKKDGTQVSKHEIYIIDLTKSDACDNLELKRWLELMKSTDVESFKGENKIMDEVIKKIEEVNADERIRAKLDSQVMFAIDYNIAMGEAEEKGLEKGMAKGMAKGLQQGLEQGSKQRELEIAKNMKSMGLDLEIISKATSLSIEEITKL